MKWTKAPAFEADLRRLSADELTLFRKVVRTSFVPAAERRVQDPAHAWPKRLRVRDVERGPGIWEMTWDWPNGRATFEWIEIGGEPAIRWRRIGGHEIFREPAR